MMILMYKLQLMILQVCGDVPPVTAHRSGRRCRYRGAPGSVWSSCHSSDVCVRQLTGCVPSGAVGVGAGHPSSSSPDDHFESLCDPAGHWAVGPVVPEGWFSNSQIFSTQQQTPTLVLLNIWTRPRAGWVLICGECIERSHYFITVWFRSPFFSAWAHSETTLDVNVYCPDHTGGAFRNFWQCLSADGGGVSYVSSVPCVWSGPLLLSVCWLLPTTVRVWPVLSTGWDLWLSYTKRALLSGQRLHAAFSEWPSTDVPC